MKASALGTVDAVLACCGCFNSQYQTMDLQLGRGDNQRVGVLIIAGIILDDLPEVLWYGVLQLCNSQGGYRLE